MILIFMKLFFSFLCKFISSFDSKLNDPDKSNITLYQDIAT